MLEPHSGSLTSCALRRGSLILSVEEAGQATDQKLLSRATQRMSPEERMQLFLSFQLTTTFMQHGTCALAPAPIDMCRAQLVCVSGRHATTAATA